MVNKNTKKSSNIKRKPQPIKKSNVRINNTNTNRKISNNNQNFKSTAKKEIDFDLIFLLGLIGVAFILGIIFMNIYFATFMVVGILLILVISSLVNKISKRKIARRLINFITIIALIVCIAAVIGVGAAFLYIVKKAPEFDPKKLVNSESTLVYDKSNKLIAELGAKKRENITYDEMSEVLIDAIVATEDSRFFQHNGFDAARFLKASAGQLVGNKGAGGASTLSMQVIKNSFTSSDASGIGGIIRKFTDIYLAVFKLERNYTKQEIIEFYANNHFLGSNAYGVEQAAKTYFGKHAYELNLAEASLIVGIFKAPTTYNPFINPDAATARRKTVLNLMYNHGYITKEEMELADSIPVQSLLVKNTGDVSEFQGYIDTVVDEIDKKYGVNPYNTPMLIYTNMNNTMQTKLNKIFSGETFTWENSYVQAGIAVVEVKTGKILAIGTGRNREGINTYNYATQINRQIGSSSKPIIDYAPAMELLNWSTGTIIDDSPHTYSGGKSITNSDGTYMGKITARTALAYSRNIPALKTFQTVMKAVGAKKYQSFVESFGIKTESNFHEAHSIGAFNGSNPLAMAAAYAVFANGGTYYEPRSVNKIVYRDTGEVIEVKNEGKRIISDSTAFMITECLLTAVSDGLSGGAEVSGYTIAAKTGTTNYDAAARKQLGVPYKAIPDSWLIGYNPEVSIGVWYGVDHADKNHYLDVNTAGKIRGKLFRATAKITMSKGKSFDVPKSVVKVALERGTEKLASASTPKSQIVYEWFKRGTEPTEISTKYSKLNNVTNLKAEYNPTSLSMTLSWNATSSKADGSEDFGSLGYKIYVNNKYVGFTTNTTYTIGNISEPDATYKVVTAYQKDSSNDSSGVSYTYKSSSSDQPETETYSAALKRSSSTYNVGETLPSYDMFPSSNDVVVTQNGSDVTSSAEIDVNITNSGGTSLASIPANEADTYEITYTINYKTFTKKLYRTITIQ